jgi:hypothetical protein
VYYRTHLPTKIALDCTVNQPQIIVYQFPKRIKYWTCPLTSENDRFCSLT